MDAQTTPPPIEGEPSHVAPPIARPPAVDTGAALKAATEALAVATANHATAVAAQQQADEQAFQPRKGVDVLVQQNDGSIILVPAPKGYEGDAPDRVIQINGCDYAHVDDGKNGVWIYRRM